MVASVPQYPTCFSPRTPSISIKLFPSTFRSCKFKLPKSKTCSSEPEPDETEDPVKLAFAKAKTYKKAIQSNIPIPIITPNPLSLNHSPSSSSSDPFAEGDFPKTEIIVGDASKFPKATTSKQPTIWEEDSGLDKFKVSSEPVPADDDPAKLAFAKARAYKEVAKNASFEISLDQVRESSESLRNREGSVSEYNNNGDTPAFADLLKHMAKEGRDSVTDDTISGEDFPEVEMIVGDASKENSERYEPKFASWSDPLSSTTYKNEGEFPEVEIIVGDASKFVRSKPRITLEEESGLYKPKVSSEPVPVDNDPVKLAFAKASSYKEVVKSNPTPKISPDQVPESSENWMNNEESVSEYTNNEDTLAFADLLKQMAKQSGDSNTDDAISEGDLPEVEIIVGDASKVGQAVSSEPNKTLKEDLKPYKPKFTSWESPTSDTTFENDCDFPEAEIIVGDASKFARSKPRITLEEESGLYKPKVSSEPVLVDNDRVNLAFSKASAYKEVVQSNNTDDTIPEPFLEGEFPEVKTVVGDASKFEQAVASETNKTLKIDSGPYEPKVASWGNPSSTTTSDNESDFPVVEIIVGDASKFVRSKPRITLEEESGLYKPKVSSETVSVNDPVKLPFAKSSTYKEVVQSNNPISKFSPDQESWMNIEKPASEYTNNADTPAFADLLKQMAKQSEDNNTDDTISEPFPEGDFEVETSVGDASNFGQEVASEPSETLKEDTVPYEPKVTSWGIPSSASTSENESGFPVWEIIVGDASKFGRSKPRITLEEESGLYKPKVSSERVPVDHDPAKLAYAKASVYKDVVQSRNPSSKISPDQESWMKIEKSVSEYTSNADTPVFADLLKQMAKQSGDNNTEDTISEPFQEENFPGVEIIVEDPNVKLTIAKARAYIEVLQSKNPTPKVSPDQFQQSSESRMNKEGSISEHTNNGDTPSFADLLNQMTEQRRAHNTDDTISEPFPEEALEVEINVKDPSKIGQAAASEPNATLEEDSGQCKPTDTSLSSSPSISDI